MDTEINAVTKKVIRDLIFDAGEVKDEQLKKEKMSAEKIRTFGKKNSTTYYGPFG